MGRPRDNIDLDMEDAARLGYGVHYGNYKADHPFTKDANENRLRPTRKKPTNGPRLYAKVCPVCGEKFTCTRNDRKYCSDDCKYKKDKAIYHGAGTRTKEENG